MMTLPATVAHALYEKLDCGLQVCDILNFADLLGVPLTAVETKFGDGGPFVTGTKDEIEGNCWARRLRQYILPAYYQLLIRIGFSQYGEELDSTKDLAGALAAFSQTLDHRGERYSYQPAGKPKIILLRRETLRRWFTGVNLPSRANAERLIAFCRRQQTPPTWEDFLVWVARGPRAPKSTPRVLPRGTPPASATEPDTQTDTRVAPPADPPTGGAPPSSWAQALQTACRILDEAHRREIWALTDAHRAEMQARDEARDEVHRQEREEQMAQFEARAEERAVAKFQEALEYAKKKSPPREVGAITKERP